MDYSLMASELLKKMGDIKRSHSHKKLGEFAEGEMFILKHLSFISEKALPSELSTAMHTSTARIAAILNSLERKGWITREIDETDRRRILVSLTPAGKQFAQERQRAVHDHMEMVLQKLGEDDTLHVLRILDRFIDIYQSIPKPDKSCVCNKNADNTNQSSKGETQS